MDIIKTIFDNLVFILGIAISGVISYILGIITVTQITQRRIQYEITNRILIPENVSRTPELRILYRDVEVQNFSSAIIIFQNTGYNAIVRSNISHNQSIKINLDPDKKILYAEIIECKDSADGFEIINRTINSFELGFEHLNRKEWVKISLLHTGKSVKDIHISGKIIGGSNISEMKDWTKSKLVPILFGFNGLLFGIGLSLILGYLLSPVHLAQDRIAWEFSYGIALIIISVLVTAVTIYFGTKRKFIKR